MTSRRAGTHVHYRLASDDVLELGWAMRRVASERVADLEDGLPEWRHAGGPIQR